MLLDSGLDVVDHPALPRLRRGRLAGRRDDPAAAPPGRMAIIGSGENLWDVVHVDDVALACVLALEKAPAGAIYHCADDTPTTYREFMTRTAEAIGVGRPRSIPVWLARRVAGDGPVATVVRSGRTSNAKLKAELGWQPHYPDSREGIPAAVAAVGPAGVKGSELV